MLDVATFGEWMRAHRKGMGLSRKALESRSAVSNTVLWELEKGQGKPFHERTASTQHSIANALGVPVGFLDKMSRGLAEAVVRAPQEEDQNVDLSTLEEVPPLPEFSAPVGAGKFVALPDPVDFGEPDGLYGRIIESGRFIVHITGDSMEPDYPHGCRVQFRRVRPERGQSCRPGYDYLVVNSDNEGTFKTLVAFSDGCLILCARNFGLYPDLLRVPLDMVAMLAEAEYQLGKPVPPMKF